MDIAGAKALKERLGQNGVQEAPDAATDADIPEDALPVYHWLDVRKAGSTRSSTDGAESATA